MGKKRRIITNPKKFGRKHFNFLDSIDGSLDGDLKSSKIDTHISRIVVTDRGNQTMSFIARCHGPGDTTTGNLQADHVIYTVDGVTLHGDAVILIDHTGTGRDKNLAKTLNSPALDSARAAACVGANNTDVLLSVGEHTISAAVYSENEGTKKSDYFVQTFNVARSEIVIGGLAAAITKDDTNGQVDLDLTEITVSGRRPGEEAAYDPTNTGKDSFILTCVKSNGDAVALATAKTTLADGAARTNADTDILNAAIGAGTTETFTFTFTPRTAANVALTADAKTVDVIVSKPA